MAKIYYSALVNTIRGRLRDDVFSSWNGIDYVKTYPLHNFNPRTYRQQQVRHNLCHLTNLWHKLDKNHKKLWENRASKQDVAYTGYHEFTKLNCNLLNASHSDLVSIDEPPTKPKRSTYPEALCVSVLSASKICVLWDRPQNGTNYIESYYKLSRSFCARHPAYGCCTGAGYNHYNRFVGTVKSSLGEIGFTNPWPSNTHLFFKVRSINKLGILSPFTEYKEILTT